MNKKTKTILANWYTEFREKFFKNDIPPVNEIRFTDTKVLYAVAYTYMRKTDTDKDVIAISSVYELSENQIKETLIHEMIHIWQYSHVSESRYRICTNSVAHDKIFKTKMLNINLQLEAEFSELRISETFNDNLYLNKKFCTPFFIFKNTDTDQVYKVHTSAKEFTQFKQYIAENKIKIDFVISICVFDGSCDILGIEYLAMAPFSTFKNRYKSINDKNINKVLSNIQNNVKRRKI